MISENHDDLMTMRLLAISGNCIEMVIHMEQRARFQPRYPHPRSLLGFHPRCSEGPWGLGPKIREVFHGNPDFWGTATELLRLLQNEVLCDQYYPMLHHHVTQSAVSPETSRPARRKEQKTICNRDEAARAGLHFQESMVDMASPAPLTMHATFPSLAFSLEDASGGASTSQH